jgi:hypothetical protein
MAQAVTFRAFGAVNPSFDTTCVARVISIQSRFAEGEKTFAAKPRLSPMGAVGFRPSGVAFVFIHHGPNLCRYSIEEMKALTISALM